MSERIKKFSSALPESVDAAIIVSPSNKSYLLSKLCDDAGTLVVTKKYAYFITDSRYFEAMQSVENDNIKVILQKNLYEQIYDILSTEKCSTVCVETSYISVDSFKKIKSALKEFKVGARVDAGKIIASLRAIKSKDEIEKIKIAQGITDDAFSYILSQIKPGKSEKELALELEFYMRSKGARFPSFDIIFIAGKNTSLPHGVPSDYKLQGGDLITMDFGADFDGYKSDMTRTVALGSINEDKKRVYDTVLSAQIAALEQIRAGKKCSEIDSIARKIISNAGFDDYFGHALGHSVGLDIHESPNFSPKCSDILKSSMVLTVEPGIYIPGDFGVRIEDLVVIMENGAENITKSDKSLIII